jgi:hypothetical protein
MVVHTTCDTCHGSTNPTVIAAIAAGIAGTHATCETCHTSSYATLHAAGDSAHVVTSACFNSTCHTSDVSVIHTTGYGFSPHAAPPGCAACHAPGKTPSTNCFSCHTQSQLNAAHSFTHADASANAADANSTACTACHGTDLPTVHSGLGCFCHTASYLSEMAGLQAAGRAECADCHTGSYAAHGFDVAIASGHNTTTYGRRGAYSRFDGSQGVTLKDTAGNTVETTWGLPTADVFWSQDASAGADAPAAAMKTDHQGHPLGWNSVITCQDCHTGLNAAGPHGANDNWGIDPNYPEPYTDAINSHYTLSGVAARISPNSTSTGSTQLGVDPAKGMAAVTASMTANNEADGTSGSYAVICAKCHKLFDYTNAYKSGNYSAGSHGFTFINATGISNDSNTAHASHHWDITGNGAADCTNCHLAVPHGWIRPRLLVNGFTGPYVVNSGGVTMTVNSTADPAPYWAGRGMLSATGNYQGMGPLSSSDDHSLTASGGAVWTEANCIACAGGSTSTVNPSALEHSGVPTDAGKLK